MEMKNSRINFNGLELNVAHRDIDKKKQTLLFLHGRGDSSASYKFFLESNSLKDYNVVVPDLIGYGKSSHSKNLKDYEYSSQIGAVEYLLEKLELSDVSLIAHCMGGNIATMLCSQKPHTAIKRLMVIEPNMTENDISFPRLAVEKYAEGKYDQWFRNELPGFFSSGSGVDNPSAELYTKALRECDPKAFLHNAREIVELNTAPGSRNIADLFFGLGIDKTFCYGSKSLEGNTLKLLKQNCDYPPVEFPGTGHFPHIDKPEDFINMLLKKFQ